MTRAQHACLGIAVAGVVALVAAPVLAQPAAAPSQSRKTPSNGRRFRRW